MRRRGLACLTLALAVTGFTACDTNDGREMEPPSSYARFQLQSTAPSTAPTTVPPPTEVTVPTTSIPTTLPSTSTVASTTPTSEPDGSSPVADSAAPGATDAAGSQPASTQVAGAVDLGFPDLADQGVQLTGPWEPGAAIDASFTCDGAGDTPLITWSAPPAGTAELALAAVDETAGGFIHWLVIQLPVGAGSLGGADPVAVGSEAINSFDQPGWGGPCPPPGSGPHTYRFTLYALSQAIELPVETPAPQLLAAVEGVTVGVATFTGTYERA